MFTYRNNGVSLTAIIAFSLLIAATALFCTLNLLWGVRAGIPSLSANSEFFAYTWIYGIRWGSGENIVFPHSQLIFPIFALIDKLFQMTKGDTAQIIAGWRRISVAWPIFLEFVSLLILFGSVNRKSPLIDALVSASIFLVSVPLFLSDHALNSLSYHSLSVPLALCSLPFWHHYYSSACVPPRTFYVSLGLYTAACALGKPTFLAFAAPFFAMELVRSIKSHRIGGLIISGIVAIVAYLLWVLLFYRSAAGVVDHFLKMLLFMQSQANWYDVEKGATPFHWYAGYVVGKMGPMPSALIAFTFVMLFVIRNRTMVSVGATVAITCALFCLYSRSQLHAQPEFIALLMTTAIASFRLTSLAESLQLLLDKFWRNFTASLVSAMSLVMIMWTIAFPPNMLLHGFAETMWQFDAVTIPSIFEQPKHIRTIVLESYPRIPWGVADAWCRGSVDIFGARRSPLLDDAFGNVTCMVTQENNSIDIFSYNRAIFSGIDKDSLEDTIKAMKSVFPNVVARFSNCRVIPEKIPGYNLNECELVNPQ